MKRIAMFLSTSLLLVSCGLSADNPNEGPGNSPIAALHQALEEDYAEHQGEGCVELPAGVQRCTYDNDEGVLCAYLVDASGEIVQETCRGSFGTYECYEADDTVACTTNFENGTICYDVFTPDFEFIEGECEFADEVHRPDDPEEPWDDEYWCSEEEDGTICYDDNCSEEMLDDGSYSHTCFWDDGYYESCIFYENGAWECNYGWEGGYCYEAGDADGEITSDCFGDEYEYEGEYYCEPIEGDEGDYFGEECIYEYCEEFYDENGESVGEECFGECWVVFDQNGEVVDEGCVDYWEDNDNCVPILDDDGNPIGEECYGDGFEPTCEEMHDGSTVCVDEECEHIFDAEGVLTAVTCRFDEEGEGFECSFEEDGSYVCHYWNEEGFECNESFNAETDTLETDCPEQ